MATPYVTGLAAMIKANNPDYTSQDVVNSIKEGGEPVPSLLGMTASGRAVNAWGSLSYIDKPTGLTGTIKGSLMND
ncbi:MAG: hypothetical protein A2176_05170 [Spirochaetes bacterium RBG_13_51_14]|nr:MAG: hypothetical protein A2176_05170 [Spirochaetes bacterium RBG_13_51_14]